MRVYTNKRLYSVPANLAPVKERFRAAAGCNTKNVYGIEPLHTLIAIRIFARGDLSCIMVEKQLRQYLKVFCAEPGHLPPATL